MFRKILKSREALFPVWNKQAHAGSLFEVLSFPLEAVVLLQVPQPLLACQTRVKENVALKVHLSPGVHLWRLGWSPRRIQELQLSSSLLHRKLRRRPAISTTLA
mmetsp:Transcript_13042/g.25582  ORF Transcript_13042/g.25582 Transcript_13042/m.25582 type:complete len:104 (+) Transcript_13042:120-431(+)